MGDNIDLDITHYIVDDLFQIFNIILPEQLDTPEDINKLIPQIIDKANTLIARMKIEKNGSLEVFFGQARDKLLTYIKELNENIADIANDTTESIDKVWQETNLKDKSDKDLSYFTDKSRVIIERANDPVQTSTAPVIAQHIVNIDSQYRPDILPYSTNPLSNTFNTSFTFNLSTPITKAINMYLYSYQIPTSWNAFNAKAGNTYFMYNGIIITIPDGNYTAQTLVTAINTIAATNISTSGLIVTYSETTNRISFENTDLLAENVTVIFFLQANIINFSSCTVSTLTAFTFMSINTTLGWLLGFRTSPANANGDVSIVIAAGQKITADVPPDTYGPKYFILSIEDYNSQRLTSGLYGITKTKNQANISVADYFKTINVSCKLQSGSLTQAQLFAINAITTDSTVQNLSVGYNNKLAGPVSGAAFALIPLPDVKRLRPDPLVKLGSDLFIFKRHYLAPTYLERFTVTLSDDKGNLVNLFDNDWSFSLIIEEQLN